MNLLLSILLLVFVSRSHWRRAGIEPVEVRPITEEMQCTPHLNLIPRHYAITANVPCDLVTINNNTMKSLESQIQSELQ